MDKIDGPKVHMQFEEKDLERLQKIMKRHKLNRSQAIRNMVSLGLDVYEDLSKLGVPQAVAVFDGLKNRIKDIELAPEGDVQT